MTRLALLEVTHQRGRDMRLAGTDTCRCFLFVPLLFVCLFVVVVCVCGGGGGGCLVKLIPFVLCILVTHATNSTCGLSYVAG